MPICESILNIHQVSALRATVKRAEAELRVASAEADLKQARADQLEAMQYAPDPESDWGARADRDRDAAIDKANGVR
ncbi:hypothetical protein [Rhodococcus marinonascens]|uniref:hypothetical protein n=1 Tax=Rhodococcus marinonascens TaxID=38311 RepID=UPI000934928A|nr:hypothetical protein [Rhodococcus marinonascens]